MRTRVLRRIKEGALDVRSPVALSLLPGRRFCPVALLVERQVYLGEKACILNSFGSFI